MLRAVLVLRGMTPKKHIQALSIESEHTSPR
uniref:Uncharacterized protein n=1 Tax=Arundo donax TaxID=35708 RepID=A0A0A8YBH7_ARUDO